MVPSQTNGRFFGKTTETCKQGISRIVTGQPGAIKAGQSNRLCLIDSHCGFDLLVDLPRPIAGQQPFIVTLLREPVSRVFSE